MWTFVGSKAQPRWLWIALERCSRRVLAWFVGDRNEQSAFAVWDRLPVTPLQRLKGTFCTDLWSAYDGVLLGVKRLTRRGETNHLERGGDTVRQQFARLVCKTRSFSKSNDLLDAALTLAFHRSNASP